MIVVALAGLARSGKTTTATLLANWCMEHSLSPIFMSFAEPMKAAAKRLGLDKETNPSLYRATLQRWGETRRDPNFRPSGHPSRRSGEDYWLRRVAILILQKQLAERDKYAALALINKEKEFCEKVLIFDDLRYINELEFIRCIGGTTVFVDGRSRIKDIDAPFRQHESEALATYYTDGLMPDNAIDFLITNDGSITVLKNLVNRLAPVWLDMSVMS